MKPNISTVIGMIVGIALGYLLARPDPNYDRKLQAQQNILSHDVFKTNLVETPFSWNEIESSDYRIYIKNLRAIKCPEETIRELIMADLDKVYKERLRPFRNTRSFSYWQTPPRVWSSPEVAWLTNLADTEREKRAVIRELLGFDPLKELSKNYGGYDTWSKLPDTFSPEKQDAAVSLGQKYEAMKRAVYGRDPAGMSQEDWEEIANIDKRYKEELKTVLSPEEQFEYELRTSKKAENQKSELTAFFPTESEFRAIFKLKESFPRVGTSLLPGDDLKEIQRQMTDYKTALKKTLGDERFNDYQMATTPAYSELIQRGLAPTVAKEVYSQMTLYNEQLHNINNSFLTSAEKQAQTTQLKSQVLSTVLGSLNGLSEQSIARYRNGGGSWMRKLE